MMIPYRFLRDIAVPCSLVISIGWGCARPNLVPPGNSANSANSANVASEPVEMSIEVSDSSQDQVDCSGVLAERVHVEVDGALAGELKIPCFEGARSPAEVFVLTLHVTKGSHRVSIRTERGASSASRVISVPVIEKVQGEGGTVEVEGAHVRVLIDPPGLRIADPVAMPEGEL